MLLLEIAKKGWCLVALYLPHGNVQDLARALTMLEGVEQRIFERNPQVPEDVGRIVVAELLPIQAICTTLFLGGPITPRRGETRQSNENALLALRESWQRQYSVLVVTSALFFTKAVMDAIGHDSQPMESKYECWRIFMRSDAYHGFIAAPGHPDSTGTTDERNLVELRGLPVIDLHRYPELIPEDVRPLFAHRFVV